MNCLLDTNVVSEARRRDPNPGFAAWWDRVSAGQLYLSALTVGELQRGVERVRQRGDREQADALHEWLIRVVHQFADRILPVDAAVAVEWGAQPHNQPIPVIDGLIAATATAHGLTLVTRNGRDVERTGVRLHNPFTAEKDGE
ncbi:MAG: PIN domain-containing protein [Pseudonocardiaceae bacterium]|nr:PIN domain-containing protein [Pseudonocardiaceae bacterium]